MWEIWEWDGRYIKGKKIKRFRAKQTAFEYAENHIACERIVEGDSPGDYYLESKDGSPIGIIIDNRKKKGI